MIPRSGSRRLSPEMWEDTGRVLFAGLLDDAVSYTPNVEADEVVDDIATVEVTATGYVRAELAGRVASWDSTNERWRYQCTSPDFGPIDAGTDASGWFIAEEISDDTDSPLLAVLLFAAPEATDGSAFIVTVGAEGAVRSAEAP